MPGNQNIEWKESWMDGYLKWIGDFANARGGKIIIGKNDNGEIVGVANAKRLMEDIPNIIQTLFGIICDVDFKNEDGKESGWMRPKNVSGEWREPFDPYEYGEGFVESNAAQSTWFVPHNIDGLAELMGGKELAVKKLNEQFTEAEKLNFTSGTSHEVETHPEYRRIPINYGNQPSMQTAFIFNKLGRYDLSQYWSKKIIEKAYSGLGTGTGYNGDEDQGLMGSLNVLMKIGLFQITGGTEDDPAYEITGPVFDEVVISLNPDYFPGETFTIKKQNPTDNYFIEHITFNGKAINNFTLKHSEITNGGELELKKES
jgi:putative alpha-1,2-mannosidase